MWSIYLVNQRDNARRLLVVEEGDVSAFHDHAHDCADACEERDAVQTEKPNATLLAILDGPVHLEAIVRVIKRLGSEAQIRDSSVAHESSQDESLRLELNATEYEETIEKHALIRWARCVVPVIRAPKDLRTIDNWARFLAVSSGALRNWCLTARLPPRRSLLFGRLLRVVVLSRNSTSRIENFLDVVDRRTVANILRYAGFSGGDRLPSHAGDFLEQQQLITDVEAISVVRRLLEEDSSSSGRTT
jgi:hypothetical protein